jgi:MFS family permease
MVGGGRRRSLAYWFLIPAAMPPRLAERCLILAAEMIAAFTVTMVVVWRTTGAPDSYSAAVVGLVCASCFVLTIPLNEWMHRRLDEPPRQMNRLGWLGTAAIVIAFGVTVIMVTTGWDWLAAIGIPLSLVGGAALLYGLLTSSARVEDHPSTDLR